MNHICDRCCKSTWYTKAKLLFMKQSFVVPLFLIQQIFMMYSLQPLCAGCKLIILCFHDFHFIQTYVSYINSYSLSSLPNSLLLNVNLTYHVWFSLSPSFLFLLLHFHTPTLCCSYYRCIIDLARFPKSPLFTLSTLPQYYLNITLVNYYSLYFLYWLTTI